MASKTGKKAPKKPSTEKNTSKTDESKKMYTKKKVLSTLQAIISDQDKLAKLQEDVNFFADEYGASDARGLTTEQIAVVQKHRKNFEAIAKELGLDDVAEARRLAQRVALHLL
jgi:DNA-binding ferritin-like protein